MKKKHIPCENCGANKWKTQKKENKVRLIVACRNCGAKRNL